MPATQRDVRNRIGAVKNIQKITGAMQLVAAARLRRAEQRIEALRPYASAIRRMTRQAAEAAGNVPNLPILDERENVSSVGLLLKEESNAACHVRPNLRAQRLTRSMLTHLWRPVGSGVMPRREVAFLVDYLFSGENGVQVVERIDRHIDRLPGLQDLHLLTGAMAKLSA